MTNAIVAFGRRAGQSRAKIERSFFEEDQGEVEREGVIDELSDASPGERNGAVEIRVSAEEAEVSMVRPNRPPITLEQLIPYHRGVFFATVALKRRFGELKNQVAFKEVDRYQQMAKE
jgi:hypothetical protein